MLNVSAAGRGRRAPFGARLRKRHTLPALAAVCVFFAFTFVWWQVLRAEVVSYGTGAPDEIRFQPARATEGERIEICFSSIDWKRPCPGQFVTYFYPFKGSRLDLDVHKIVPPPEMGPIGLKCRKWDVPYLGGNDANGKPLREEGPGFVTGFNASQCLPLDYLYPIYKTLPRIPIDVRRKR